MRPAIFVLLLMPIFGQLAGAAELPTDSVKPIDYSEMPHLGTTDEYINGSRSATVFADIKILGITATDGVAQFKNGPQVRGVRICSVTAGGPGMRAGLHSEQVATAEILTAGFFGAAMFFPPAAAGAFAVQALNIGVSYDLILAVDGQRTHNLQELQQALTGSTAGELLYLVVIRGRRRKNLVVTLQ